ncbi:MAG: glycosyltransferase family 4 protein, partial [Actinomycetota bacterium]|nr:glycosyltransferase family 4 protein [Actinomycetota bacterium]
MTTILYVQPVAEEGGSDQALLRMIRGLPPGFTCHVALPGPSPMADRFRAAGARLHVVPMRRLTAGAGWRYWLRYVVEWPVATGRLARLARRVRADVVHTNSLHSLYGWAAARLCRLPHVWHAREIVVQSRAALAVERFLARRFADVVIAMSEAIAAQLHPGNTRVVWDGADPDEFTPAKAGRFRSAESIPEDVPIVASVGRIDTWKGVDVLLEAFATVREAVPEAILVVAGPAVRGKEAYAAGLERRAAAIGGVRWLGPRADVPEVLADVDVFVLPSTEPEPFGLVLVEALASGARVVATDAGGAPEIVRRSPT